jgi:hypothetical protein
MKPQVYAIAPLAGVNHRMKRLLPALEPHLHGVSLRQDQVLYGVGDPLRHAIFPNDTLVSLVAVLKDGRSAEMVVYGREGALGAVGSVTSASPSGATSCKPPVPPLRWSWSAYRRSSENGLRAVGKRLVVL